MVGDDVHKLALMYNRVISLLLCLPALLLNAEMHVLHVQIVVVFRITYENETVRDVAICLHNSVCLEWNDQALPNAPIQTIGAIMITPRQILLLHPKICGMFLSWCFKSNVCFLLVHKFVFFLFV